MTKEEFNAMAKRYLTMWDCTKGEPMIKPNWNMPFRYERGDYFIVSEQVYPKDLPIVYNQRPCGTEFTDTDRDHEVETDLVLPNDCYIFDGERWLLYHRLDKVFEGIPMVDC